jgi:TolB-like protein/Flp pilus assembly protein TadD
VTALSVGRRLGPYEILAPLGAGGMGEVYRARDRKLDRDVAIKVLPESVAADPDALARFEREAKAVAALSHPNILAIHDFGTHDGVTYAVTELLHGETLRAKLDAGPISQKLAVDYALQVAKGLSAAHEKGIVHRDLKPENLFATRDRHLKILDFGLASAPTSSGHTEPGAVMGTVGYMSPEQVKGLQVDHRSDIFSFGTILYELLSGKKAFQRDTNAETIAAILMQEPSELAASGPNISPALDHIVKHCLEKDRNNRFQSAKDIAFALSEQSSLTATSGVQLAVAPMGKRKVLVAATTIVLLAAAGVLILRRTHMGRGEARGVKRVAVLPFENVGAPEDEYFADGIADEIRGKLTSVPGFQVIARGSSTPYKKTAKTPNQIAEELEVGYLLTATVRWEKSGGGNRVHVSPELIEVSGSGAPTSKWQHQFDAALTDVFQVQSDIASRVAQALGVALGAQEEKLLSEKPTQNLAAYDAFLKGGEVTKGFDPSSLRQALGFYEKAVALDPGFARAWASVSMVNSGLYANSTPSPEVSERARQAAEKAVALAPNAPQAYLALGEYRRLVLVDMHGALEQFARGKSLAPGSASLASALGTTEESLGQWNAAVEDLQQAQRLDPRSATNFYVMGEAFLYLRRYKEARQAFNGGLALAPRSLNLIQRRAMSFLGEGDLAGARASLAAGLKDVDLTELVAYVANYNDLVWTLTDEQRELLLRLTPAAFDGDRGAWALCLVQAHALKGDTPSAQTYAEEARKAYEDQLRAAPNDDGRHFCLGLSLAYLGRKEEAIREGKRAVDLMPVSRDALNAPYDEHELARIYTLVGEHEKALDVLERLLKIPYYVSPGWLKIDPTFDPLRKNPRFQKLVARAT